MQIHAYTCNNKKIKKRWSREEIEEGARLK